MARTILTVLLVVSVGVLVGCHGVDSGRSQLMPAGITPAEAVEVGQASEAEIIEQVAINREAYRQGLELLIAHYKEIGNNVQLAWAENELKELDGLPQYNYIVEASVAGPDLRASTSIIEANYIYQDIVRLEKKAGRFVVVKNEKQLRMALSRYNQLIRRYPSSDKIDDAAYRAAGIYEHFKDYAIALLYYRRAFEWDSETTNPARFKAARLLDKHMSRRAEALELYEQAVEKGGLSTAQNSFAQGRIAELSKSDEGEL